MTDIKSLTAAELLRLYRRRELSPVEVTRDQLDRIETFQPAINAFIIVDRDGALEAAQASEARWQKGEPRGPRRRPRRDREGQCLAEGLSRRAAARLTSDRRADEGGRARGRAAARERRRRSSARPRCPNSAGSAPAIRRSPASRAIRGSSTARTGGSSGGAAAAALLNLGHLHIGTDGAGSIRIPAAFTGVFGIKPSFGRVAAYPASPFSILAHLGPLTRTVSGRRADAVGDRRARTSAT